MLKKNSIYAVYFYTEHFFTCFISLKKLELAGTKLSIFNYGGDIREIFEFHKSLKILFKSKFKIIGKSYKLLKKKKSNNFLRLILNKSHPTLIFFKKIILKKQKKNKFLIMSANLSKLNFFSKLITHKRPLDFYTKRGIKLYKYRVISRNSGKAAYG